MAKNKLSLKKASNPAPNPAGGGRSRAANAQRQSDLSGRAQLISGSSPQGTVVINGQRVALDGIQNVWFNPGQPLIPIAQDATRQMDYPFGVNLRINPRQQPDEGIGFPQLRNLADAYDILRMVIETRKDQLATLDWKISPKDVLDESEEMMAKCKEVQQLFEHPSVEPTLNTWDNWLRAVLEDLFVLDAVAIYPRANLGGNRVVSLDLIDGATLKRIIDARGMTPLPPNPAYQQILHGMPAVDYSADKLLYWMRNVRTNRIYGYSPVEQIILTVNIALRKQMYTLNYYTEGNIPEAFCGVPDNWGMDQIKQFQLWWDAMMEGDLAQRRKMKFVPMDASKMKETKDPNLKDDMDEWLTRVICFAFSVSPSPFIRELNRSTGQSNAEQARDEGLFPVMKWLKGKFNEIISEVLGIDDVEFEWQIKDDVDPKVQSEIDIAYVNAGILHPAEVRKERLGKEPLTAEQLATMSPDKGGTQQDPNKQSFDDSDKKKEKEKKDEENEKLNKNVMALAESQNQLAKVVTVMATREPVAPSVTFNEGAIKVEHKSGDVSLTVPERTVNIEPAQINLSPADVNVVVEPAQVSVTVEKEKGSVKTVTTYERDPETMEVKTSTTTTEKE